MFEALRGIVHNVRPADAADILLFAVVLYAAMQAVEWSIGRAGWLLIGGLAALQAIAASYDLVLVSWFLRGFFGVFVLALTIVFHDDLRRGFRRAEGWLRHGWKRRPAEPRATDVLVQAAFALAERRAGALFVLPGRESLERLVEGGIPLAGHLSTPLLLSLFDPHSPGHDGAAVIEGNAVTRFAAHLPLADDPRRHRGLGTRHRSALGLAERSDALVVVVSEERGAVMTACAAKLEPMPDAEHLREQLAAFVGHPEAPRAARRAKRAAPLRNWRVPLLAVALSASAWLLFAYQVGSMERTVTVPIVFRNVPEQAAAEVARFPEAQVTLRGSPRAFRLHDPADVEVSLDVSGLAQGRTDFALTPSVVTRPADLRVIDVRPRSIHFPYVAMRAPPAPAPR